MLHEKILCFKHDQIDGMSCHDMCSAKEYTKDDANEPFLNLVKRISHFTYFLPVYLSVMGPCILFKEQKYRSVSSSQLPNRIISSASFKRSYPSLCLNTSVTSNLCGNNSWDNFYSYTGSPISITVGIRLSWQKSSTKIT